MVQRTECSNTLLTICCIGLLNKNGEAECGQAMVILLDTVGPGLQLHGCVCCAINS